MANLEMTKQDSVLQSDNIPGNSNQSPDIEEYVYQTLGIDKSNLSAAQKKVYYKNFSHLMCHIIQDVKVLDGNIRVCNQHLKKLNKEFGNKNEYQRRKYNYFIKRNERALEDIRTFIVKSIPDFLADYSYDTLACENENGLSDFYYKTRYKYSWYNPDYYNPEFPFNIAVKVEQYVKDKYETLDGLDKKSKLIQLYKRDHASFVRLMHKYIDDDHVMTKIVDCVRSSYHLHNREEIFQTLETLFNEKNYQSFNALGMIQMEGLFDDYCRIIDNDVYHENEGTLVEKAEKTLGKNEYNLLEMYPYFAFDVPVQRNEVAHRGMLFSDDAEKTAYLLVLDLHTLSEMTSQESYSKFSPLLVIRGNLDLFQETNPDEDVYYDYVFKELLGTYNTFTYKFMDVLSDTEKYQEEISFYKDRGIPEVIKYFEDMVHGEGFWKAVRRAVDAYVTTLATDTTIASFALILKNKFIDSLEGNAKNECIEVSKKLNAMKK